MIRVYIAPDYSNVPEHADNGGIRRVVEAMTEHLPKFGIEVVHRPEQAEIICNHGGMLVERPGVPNVHIGHGLYWSRQPWGDNFQEVNQSVVESMIHSIAWTVPSEWVGRAVRRGGFWYPEVVYHGVDGDKFLPSKTHGDYTLWNKARADYVSDPKDMVQIAAQMPRRKFISTLGRQLENVQIIGSVSHSLMKKYVSEAAVYLATTRETFGIGTLEALAYGIPVAGWDWGGQSEIIVKGETGYLAPPGDYQALEQCIEQCISERDRLSQNAIQDVRTRWKWEPRIEQYANIFKRVHARWYAKRPKISILVTAYKLDRYLPQCLDSVLRQTFQDFECIVIDDASLESTRLIVSDYAGRDNRIRYLSTPNNFGLPGARNYGVQNSSGKYIRHMDADDFLAPNALELENEALDKDRGVHVVYGHLEVVREDGTQILEHGQPVRGDWPPNDFNWYQQMNHLNQLPSCAMARREVYELSGGYRERMRRNEDAEFWCRISSLGFRIKKFTQAVTYYHRQRDDSKGAVEWKNEGGEPDWTAWFPWRMGGTDFQSARDIIRKRGEEPQNTHLVPFGVQGKPPQGLRFWYVHDYAYPIVSIIITCGPGHKKYILDALDSIQAQTYPDWECIVVNDTGEPWPPDLLGAPWAKVVNMQGNQGTSAARNEGYRHVRGKYIIWMDADDYWVPWFLDKMVSYAEHNYGVIYSDLIKDEGKLSIYRYEEFVPERVPLAMRYPGSSVLIPRQITQAVFDFQGGFDTSIPGMEDWDFQIAVHHLGFCAYHVPEPLFVYRMKTSTKRERDYDKIEDIRAYIDQKWAMYRKGEKKIMCGCNTKRNPPNGAPSSTLSSSGNFTNESIQAVMGQTDKASMVVVEYIGPVQETFSIRSRLQRSLTYRFGNNEYHKYKTVFLQDAEFLMGLADQKGDPLYRVIGKGASPEVLDPASFLGQPIGV